MEFAKNDNPGILNRSSDALKSEDKTNIERNLTTIIEACFVRKVNRWVVTLGIENEKAQKVSMTDRQYGGLIQAFARTPKGYSTKRAQVIGVWFDDKHYAFTKFCAITFTEPKQFNLGDLIDD